MHQLRESMSKVELALLYHLCLGLPPKITLLKSIKNDQLELVLRLSYKLIIRHLPQTIADLKDRMRRIRQCVQSTRNPIQQIQDARVEVKDMNPTKEVRVEGHVH